MPSASPTPPRRHGPLTPRAAERVSAGCYGALVASATLVGLGHASLGRLVAIVVLTNCVYYATHVFAYSLGDPDEHGVGPGKVVAHHLVVSGPIVSATFLPLVVVVALTLFGFEQELAVAYGVSSAMLTLVVVATVGAFLRGFSPLVVALTGVLTVVVSAALVLTKLALH